MRPLRPLLLLVPALILGTLTLGCTCQELSLEPTPVPHAEAIVYLSDASEETRTTILQAMAAEGAFGGGDTPVPLPCTAVRTWAVGGDDAVSLDVETELVSEDCRSGTVSRRAFLYRHLAARPDERDPPGGGFRAPRLAFQQTWMGVGWNQRYGTWGIRNVDRHRTLGQDWADRMLEAPVQRRDRARDVAVRAWRLPPWIVGRSTYRGVIEEHQCLDGGPTAARLVLSRHGDEHAYIPGPSLQAMERVIGTLGARVVNDPGPDALRCDPAPASEMP